MEIRRTSFPFLKQAANLRGMPLEPKEFFLYYAAASILALLIFLRRKPRRGMLLRGWNQKRTTEGRNYSEIAATLKASGDPRIANLRPRGPDPERSLNVIFNYNGHSWDAHEVLGVPAGASLERVQAGYRDTLKRVDDESKPFVEAAYRAISGSSAVNKLGN